MDRPKLRKVDRYEHQRGSEAMLVVRDPLGLAEPFAIDAEFSSVLDLLDGAHTLPQVRQSLLMRHGMDLPVADLRAFVHDLQEAGLLDDEVFRDRWADAHADFLEATVRAPVLAGVVYPDHPGELVAALERAVPSSVARVSADSHVAGVMVPHDPPDRAASTQLIDRTLRDLPDPGRLEAVVVLGSDHGPGLLPYVVTAKPHRTPLGVVPTSGPIIEALERRLPWISREEIRHREAISIEIATLYLQQIYGDGCPPIVPVLCGQTVLAPRDGEAQEAERFAAAIEALCEDREILLWVSGELSHGGVAYGRPPLSDDGERQLAARDRAILDVVGRADPSAVAVACATDHPQGRCSGGPPLTTAAKLLPVGFRTQVVQYDLVEAPEGTDGVVGQAGLRFVAPAVTRTG
ncbi:MAG: AmmeMemoRadiSam system protein B [Myxococcota bacterium]